jgi:hypothetical protein
MDKVTQNRKLSPRLMLRVDSCAIIFQADKPEKIAEIATNRQVSEADAARMYTLGALKAAKRRGAAHNYVEALDQLEAEQVKDRGCPLTRTISADRTAETVQSINRVNAASPMRINRIDYTRRSWADMDNQLLTEYAQPANWQVVQAKEQPPKRNHNRNMGKVLGELYAQWEARTTDLDPACYTDATVEIVEANIKRFMAEYASRLSRTVQARIGELKVWLDEHSDAVEAAKGLMSVKGKTNPDTAKLHSFVANLHWNFLNKDAITAPEFVQLLYKYTDPQPSA